MKRRATPRFPRWLDGVVVAAATVMMLRAGTIVAAVAISAVLLGYGLLRDVDVSNS